MVHVNDGRVVGQWIRFDLWGIYQQLLQLRSCRPQKPPGQPSPGPGTRADRFADPGMERAILPRPGVNTERIALAVLVDATARSSSRSTAEYYWFRASGLRSAIISFSLTTKGRASPLS
jgi:hypothetical protein